MSIGTVSIQRATLDDAAALNGLWVEANRARLSGALPAGYETRAAGALAKRMNSEDSLTWIAKNEEGAVGMSLACAARDQGPGGPIIPLTAHISLVAVAPAWWGRGIAHSLMKTTLEGCRARGDAWAQLYAVHDNERALRLYARLGFRPTGEEKVGEGGESSCSRCETCPC
jgi:ribosomal protein S18 acetylase RimI-like enzyme